MVTDEALLAETTVWPNFFLMNIFFAVKGSKLFIIIIYIQHISFRRLYRMYAYLSKTTF